MLWQDYFLPTTLRDAFSLLADYKGEARVVAGGTDSVLEIQQGHQPPVKALVDVARIAGANEIRREGEYVVVGCGVTHTMIVESALIRQGGAALAEGCGVIGGPQVLKVVAAHDIGRAINPLTLNGQIEGGIVMGMGNALTEEYIVENGVPYTQWFSR